MLDEFLARFASASSAIERSSGGPDLPTHVSCLVVVGASCAGKTTIVSAIRNASIDKVVVPNRYITRPLRQNDCNNENVHLDDTQFDKALAAGTVAWTWTRKLHENKRTRYGFAAAPTGSLAVYSANNALYRNIQSLRPAAVLAGALWIGVHAPLALRRRRMQERSADLSVPEREFRLSDESVDMEAHVHLIVRSDEDTEQSAAREVCDLIEGLGDYR